MNLDLFENATLASTEVTFAIQNGLWLNATQVAKTYNKKLSHYWDSKDTKVYLEALNKLPEFRGTYKDAVEGRNGGTYIHPDLAIHFARWCNPSFAIDCDRFIRNQLVEAKDKEIAQLKAQKKLCNIYDNKWTACRGLIQHTAIEYKESEIKDFMYSMGYIIPEHKVTRFWRVTQKGIDSGLVKADEMNTPIYDMNKVGTYMDNFKSLLNDMKPIDIDVDI